jgi:hypothetical protein
MSTALKVIGSLLCAAGLLVTVYFGHAIAAASEAYNRSALAAERNPGHAMYQAEFGRVQIERGFQLTFASLGFLLALNGATLFGIGAIAKRVGRN